MPTRLRKVRKHRGSRSHGWGQSAGHRGAGSHGGFGRTGGHKHGWTYVVSHRPDHFGKRGFYHHSVRATTMNVGELDQIANGLLLKGHATREDEGIFIDLNKSVIFANIVRLPKTVTLLFSNCSSLFLRYITSPGLTDHST